MLISKSSLRSDPRVMAGLIAQSALAQVDALKKPQSAEVYAATLLRLLEAYRVEMPDVAAHRGVGEFLPFEVSTADEWGSEGTQSDVLEAIERTRKRISELERVPFANAVSAALSHAFGLAKVKASIDSGELRLLKQFLKKFTAELQAA